MPSPIHGMRVAKTLAPNYALKSQIRQLMDKAARFCSRLADDDVKEELAKWHNNWRHCHSQEFAGLIDLYVVSLKMGDAAVHLHCGIQLEQQFDVKTLDHSARTVTFKDDDKDKPSTSSDTGDKKKKKKKRERSEE